MLGGANVPLSSSAYVLVLCPGCVPRPIQLPQGGTCIGLGVPRSVVSFCTHDGFYCVGSRCSASLRVLLLVCGICCSRSSLHSNHVGRPSDCVMVGISGAVWRSASRRSSPTWGSCRGIFVSKLRGCSAVGCSMWSCRLCTADTCSALVSAVFGN